VCLWMERMYELCMYGMNVSTMQATDN
jgi:hypothetical protein